MSKVRVLVDLRIEVEPPRYISRYRRSMEDVAREMEYWAREFEAFVRDHRSQDPVNFSVERVYEDQCSHCASEWECDSDGMPMCCGKAEEEWLEQKEVSP